MENQKIIKEKRGDSYVIRWKDGVVLSTWIKNKNEHDITFNNRVDKILEDTIKLYKP